MSLTPDDVFDVLKLVAAFDQRTVGEEDVTAWGLVATQQGWDASVAKRVVVDYYGSGADKRRITPATITDKIKKLRNEAAETFEAPHIPDDIPAGTNMAQWFRDRKDAHVARALSHWARTGEDPQAVARRNQLGTGNLGLEGLIGRAPEHLRGEIESAFDRTGNLDDDDPPAGVPARR